MIVPGPQSARRLATSLVLPATYFTLVTLGVEWAYVEFQLPRSVFTLATAGLMITALTIFLGFRVSEAYERWWEARKLWGALVNVSRSFGRKVTALVVVERLPALADETEAAEKRRELIHRHLAYVNALRIGLRHGPNLAAAPNEWEGIRPFLPESEVRDYADKANVATQIVRTQSDLLRRLFGTTTEEQLAYLDLQGLLDQLYDIQGACERIKNTVFPYQVTASTIVLTWGFATLLPFAALDSEAAHDFVEVLLVVVMSLSFVLVEKLGEDLKRPFENRPNDTPMTALCRTIEIDLRQMLGETDLPPLIRPIGGVLM